MPTKPRSPEIPPKRKVEKATKASKGGVKSTHPHVIPDPTNTLSEEEMPHESNNSRFDIVDNNKVYPALISELLNICISEASEVRGAFKNRNRQKYMNIFAGYKDKLSDRDYSIIKGALYYLYDFSRVKSIDKETALWMIGIYEIPTSQIISYTSKDILKNIAKDHGLSYSNKKAEDLVENIRGVIDHH